MLQPPREYSATRRLGDGAYGSISMVCSSYDHFACFIHMLIFHSFWCVVLFKRWCELTSCPGIWRRRPPFRHEDFCCQRRWWFFGPNNSARGSLKIYLSIRTSRDARLFLPSNALLILLRFRWWGCFFVKMHTRTFWWSTTLLCLQTK